LLEQSKPAAAVIDFLMPGMNGAEVARIAQQRRPGLPIVFVSGYADTVALDGIAGAIVLRKPFDIDALGRAIHTVLH
jgi:CheY-like chemotaxis protein